jgi:hypothetical protein
VTEARERRDRSTALLVEEAVERHSRITRPHLASRSSSPHTSIQPGVEYPTNHRSEDRHRDRSRTRSPSSGDSLPIPETTARYRDMMLRHPELRNPNRTRSPPRSRRRDRSRSRSRSRTPPSRRDPPRRQRPRHNLTARRGTGRLHSRSAERTTSRSHSPTPPSRSEGHLPARAHSQRECSDQSNAPRREREATHRREPYSHSNSRQQNQNEARRADGKNGK